VQISSLFRITSHKQVVEVDDASTSPNKVSNQVLIFEHELPESAILNKFVGGSSIGAILVVDAFDKDPFLSFDNITGGETNLKVIKQIDIESFTAILCLPEDYLTFYLGQELNHQGKIFTVKIITLSDRAHRGIYADLSGPLITELTSTYFKTINKRVQIKNSIIPDNANELSLILEESKLDKTDILITTGGTGISPRDITIETMRQHIDKEIPGIMEMIRIKYGEKKPNALLSRGIAGTMGNTLIYTLPGSVKAVSEYLSEIFNTLDHLLYMINGIDIH